MVSVRISVEPETYDDLITALWEAGTAGVTDEPGELIAYFDDIETARRFGDPEPQADTDWVAQTEAAWPPLLVGKRFFLAAPWNTEPTPAGRLRLEVTPGAHCGTGRHPCTQLCLDAMERIVQAGDSVLDVGSGSGILSVAAKLLGAKRVVACDLDPESPRPVPFFAGSVDAVRSGSFDVVIANINEDVLGCLRPDLERVGKTLILSGFQNDDGEWTCLVI